MRQFYIQNEYGEKIDLQGGSVFLWEPSGLGAEDDLEYGSADGFFLRTFRDIAQVEKTGTLIFMPHDNPYKQYKLFADFVYSAKSLTLAYKPENDWYYVDVDVLIVEKSELTENGDLQVPIGFMPRTPIYTSHDIYLTIEGDGDCQTKRYTYLYPYRYSGSILAGMLDFSIDAQMDSAFDLQIAGEIENPILTATIRDTGEIIGRIDLSALSSAVGDTINYSSVPGNAGVTLITADGQKTDLTNFIGLSTDAPAFFRLPPNTPLRFAISAVSLVGVTARIRIYRYYRTV